MNSLFQHSSDRLCCEPVTLIHLQFLGSIHQIKHRFPILLDVYPALGSQLHPGILPRTALEHQTRLDPSDAYAAYRLGMLLTLYSPEDALPELTRASTLNPEVDSAVQTLRTALAVSSRQSDPSMQMVILGQTFGLLQDWELAHTAFEHAVQRDEKNAEAWAWLGEAKQQIGQEWKRGT